MTNQGPRPMSTTVAPLPSSVHSALAESARLSSLAAPLGPLAPGGDPARAYLQFVLDVLRRRRWFVIAFTVVVAGFAYFVVDQITPLYRADTQLLLDSPQSRNAGSGLAALLGGGGSDLMGTETEAAVLSSRELADRIIKVLNLPSQPFFAGTKSLFGRLMDLRRQWQGEIAAYLPESAQAFLKPKPRPVALQAAAQGDPLNRIYDIYFRNLTVRAGDRARVIDMRFVADDPKLAAAVVNTLAATYIEDQVTEARRQASKDSGWIAARVADARARVDEAMRKLDEFRTQAGLIDVNGATGLQRQLAELTQQRLQAQIRRIDIEARARQLQQLLDTGGRVEDSEIAAESQSILRLREQETQATRHLAELSTQYRDAHPRLQQAQADLDDVRAKIKAEMRRLVSAAANQARLAREQENALAAQVTELTQQTQAQGQSLLTLHLLEADLKSAGAVYEAMLSRMREVAALEGRNDAPSVRVLSRAVPAEVPFFPNKPLLVTVAAAVAGLFGILLAFLLELLDVGFRTRQQIENLTGLETVASLPMVKRLEKARRRADMRRVLRANPILAEAVRYMRVSLSLSPDPDRPVRSILVTSTYDGEGKTFTAKSLAITYALSERRMASVGEKRVVTVDCDLRQRPRTWTRRTDTAPAAGLADFLLGNAEIPDIIGTDRTTGLDHIDYGDTSGVADAPILLGSERMRFLMSELTERYDMVILDTPPVKMFPDSLVLQREVDRVLFLVRWTRTPREMALDALKAIIQAGHLNPVVGLTQVDPRHLRRYDYAAGLPTRYGEALLTGPSSG